MRLVAICFMMVACLWTGCGAPDSGRVEREKTSDLDSGRVEREKTSDLDFGRIERKKSPVVSMYRFVVLPGDLLDRYENRVTEAFTKIGLTVVSTSAAFLHSENVDSRDTCQAHIQVHKLINTTMTLVLADYLTREVVWSSSKKSYLDDSINGPLSRLMSLLAYDRAHADRGKAEAEHFALHYPEEVLARKERDEGRRTELAVLSEGAGARLKPEEKQRLYRYLGEVEAMENLFVRISAVRDIRAMGTDASLAALPRLMVFLDPAGDVNVTLEIFNVLSGVLDHFPVSFRERLEDFDPHPDAEVEAAAKKLLEQMKAGG